MSRELQNFEASIQKPPAENKTAFKATQQLKITKREQNKKGSHEDDSFSIGKCDKTRTI